MAHGFGLEFAIEESRAEAYRAAYGRMCPKLHAWAPTIPEGADLDTHLLRIVSERMVESVEAAPPEASGRDVPQPGFDSSIPAGYTYFGQFVDHDITFDPASQLMRRNDPKGLRNFRTPRLDLDSVYGRIPQDQPYLYDQRPGERGKLLIGRVRDSHFRDLPRNDQHRALIGDARNDENVMVSQLHLAFLLAHNTLVARADGLKDPFQSASDTLRWLYQYVVWNDYLKRVTEEEVHARALRPATAGNGAGKWVLGLESLYSWRRQPFIPVEFSAAAYRFGHSMVRNAYQTNERRGLGKFVPLFDRHGADDLRGRRAMSADNVIQWSWFLKMGLPRARERFPQMARKIDTKLSPALADVPVGDGQSPVLAYRNLRRGLSFGLPAGRDVASFCRTHGIAPLDFAREPDEPDALWYYILREAEASPAAGNKLGPVGSAIVCAVFASLLESDEHSYLNCTALWHPKDDPLLRPGEDNIDGEKTSEEIPDRDRSWTLASIIRISGLPVDGQDIDNDSVGNFRVTARPRRP